MTLEVIDSRYGEAKKTLHDLIIIILAKEYPLKIGEICQRLRKQFNVKLSFQAVRKSLNILTERKILIIKDKAYFINKNHILEVKRLTDQLMKNYFSGEKQVAQKEWSDVEGSYTTYTFENLIKTDQFCNEIILDWAYNLKEEDDRVFCFHSPHYWYVFGQLGLESSILTDIKANGIDAYYLADGNTLLDKWTIKFYKGHKINYKISPQKEKLKTTMGVFGDFIVQYDYPEELFNKIEEFYTNTKNLETMDITKIAQILKFKTSITMTVMKNKTIACKLKEEILSKFKKKHQIQQNEHKVFIIKQ